MRGAALGLCLLLLVGTTRPAGSTCLPDAVQDDDRLNIPVKGQSLPLGIWEYGWESAGIVAHLVRILAEEKLGTNVSVTPGPPVSLHGGLAVGTCAEPLNETHPVCDRDESFVPPYHLALEWWPFDLRYGRQWFLDNYAKQAPVFLGYMGYAGREGVHIHKQTVTAALDAEGVHLEYFGCYNTAWFRPWERFDNMSAIPPASLQQCTDIKGACGGILGRLATEYNDSVGFEVRSGETCVVCPDGKWWLSPTCRAQPDRCIPLFTGEDGQLYDNFLEKVLAHGMPVALATPMTYGDFLANFQSHRVLSFDWTPGAHFGSLQSQELAFPPHNASEFKKDIYRTMDADMRLERLGWHGLERAAPDVFFLASNIEVTRTDMNNMLDLYLELGNVSAAACSWLKQNEDLWTNWLPEADPTRCIVGNGMVTGDGLFTANRTEALKCIACPAGMKSREIGEGLRMTYACELCDPGSVQPMWGADNCVSCDMGYYQNQSGQSRCIRCSRGTYSDIQGLPNCHECDPGFTTEGTGFTSEDFCECPPGSFLSSTGRCSECGFGAVCAGYGSPPMAAEGFHLSEVNGESLSIFQCFKDVNRCPGGVVGTCQYGRESNACAACIPGTAPADYGRCEKCAGADRGPFVVAVCLFLMVLGGLYGKTSRADGERQSQTLVLLVSTGAQVVAIAQLLGLFFKISVEWQPPISTVLMVLRVFNFDLQVLRMECVGGFGVLETYACTLLVAPIALVSICLMHVCRVLVFHRGDFGDKHSAVLGTGGLLMMGFFITVATTILSPFQCQQHPNGLWTLLQYEGQMCWQGEDHTWMMVIGAMAITMPVGFICLITWLLWIFPEKMSEGDTHFLNTYSFLFLRVKPSTRWFMLAYLLRNLFIAFVPSIPNPFWQVLLLEGIFTLTFAAISYIQPWRMPIVNHLEVVISILMLILMCIASFFIHGADIQGVATVGFVMLLATIFCFPIGLGAVLIRRLTKPKEFHFFLCHHKAAVGTFARLMKTILLEQRGLKGDIFLDSDNLKDLDQLFNYVADEVDTLVVLCTREIFLRPWCLGEVATAYMCKTPMFPVYFTDFVLPDQEFVDGIEARVDLSCLTENSVGLHNVHKALLAFGSQDHLDVPAPFAAGYMEHLARLVISSDTATGLKRQCTRKIIDKHLVQTDKLKVILTDCHSSEAVAATAVLVILMRPHACGRAEDLPVNYEDLPCRAGLKSRPPCGVDSLIVMCTNSCFAQVHYLQGLCWAMEEGASKVLPVAVADSFQFPTEIFYQSLEENTARLCQLAGTTNEPELLTKYVEHIFKKIAVPLSTMSSSSVLQSQAQMVWCRLGGASTVIKKQTSTWSKRSSSVSSAASGKEAAKEASATWTVPPFHVQIVKAICELQMEEFEGVTGGGDLSGETAAAVQQFSHNEEQQQVSYLHYSSTAQLNDYEDTWVLAIECEGEVV